MEELIALLKHFHHHTAHHNEDLEEYREKLRAAGRDDLAKKLEECIDHQNKVKELIDEILTELAR